MKQEIRLTQFDEKLVRRKDFITYIAVLLLALIIIGEIGFSIWLPRRLRAEKAWEREALLKESIDLVDEMRGGCTTMKTDRPNLEGERDLALKCLDEYAKYLRQNKHTMSMEQVVEVHKTLRRFRSVPYVNWKLGKSYVFEEKLNTEGYLSKILQEYSGRLNP